MGDSSVRGTPPAGPGPAVPGPRSGPPGVTVRPPDSDYHAAVAAAWRTAAEHGTPALALVPLAPGPGEGAAGRAQAQGEPDGDDVGWLVRWANHALLELLGLDHTEIVGRPLADLSASSTAAWAAVVRRLLKGTSTETAAVVRRPDETRHPVNVELHPLGRGVQGWLVTLHPATDEEQAARTALRESEQRFRAVAEHAPTGIFLSEAGVRLGYLNQRFAELLGADPHHLLGSRWLEAVHPEDLPKLYDALQWVLGGETTEVTLRLQASAAVQRWVYLRLAPTTTPSRAAGFVGTAEDVTSRRAWEERLSYQARHDPLTGLLNQGRLIELLQEVLGSRRGADREVALALFGLDGFTDVSDTFGEEAGDRVLVEVASRLRRGVREYDTLARLSGDQFVVLLHHVRTAEQVETAVRRHLQTLSGSFRLGTEQVRLNPCAGIALPTLEDTPESLLRTAQLLRRRARTAGAGGTAGAPELRLGRTGDQHPPDAPDGDRTPGPASGREPEDLR